MRNVAEQSIKVSFYLSPTVLANGKYCERLQYHAIEFNATPFYFPAIQFNTIQHTPHSPTEKKCKQLPRSKPGNDCVVVKVKKLVAPSVM